MVTLHKTNYIGEGTYQMCYVHPDFNNLCLKLRKGIRTNKSRVDQEIKYYEKIQKRNIGFPFLSKYHGELETNLGIASVFDMVRDETTNDISASMYDYLLRDDSPFSDELFITKLKELKGVLVKNKILIRDLTAKNICCKVLANKSVELIIIDGVGHRDFIPMVEWFEILTRRKMNKIFDRKKLYSMTEHREWLAHRNLLY
ncbi:hypothetical protein FGM00_02635 [Aggregatimonas sangjinii]|uniref:PhoP regulatory network protein YrbL n=1 Tax=Aggregatimonas sangjinii TaxID=2583587 RepID=A0A5B7SKJ4_9FLAO|nr:YrbL family protein [Aggregatimonas sangjinii]QCW99065.1 hypothetical protein FGM00_02635 [Aggregatimonas sangjinii]